MLRKYGKAEIQSQAQDESQALYCQKIEKSDGEIQGFTDDLASVYAKYRAYFLWPKVFFIHQGKGVIIEKLILDQKVFEEKKDMPLINSDFMLHPAVINIQLKPEGKKAMDRQSFKNGYLRG